MRPRDKTPRVRVRSDGQCYLNRTALEILKEKAEMSGILDLHIAWQVEDETIIIWPCDKNDYSSKVNVSGARKTIQFKSRRLGRATKQGSYPVIII